MKILYCALLFMPFFVSCTSLQKSEKKNVVRINLKDEPSTLDPRKARDLSSMSITRMLFEGLTRVGKNEKAELALANDVSWTPDVKKYTFHLRDAQWSNGDPITAFDFVYAWKKVLDPNFPSDVAFQLYVIKNAKAAKEGKVQIQEVGIHALDNKTLEIDLEYPVPYFLELVAIPVFFPINSRIDQLNSQWAEGPSSFVCNGPFRLETWKHHDCIIVNKNESYWDASSVHLSKLELVMIDTEDTELKMFEKKELDWAGSPISNLPVEAIHSLKKDHTLKTKEMLGTYFIRINVEHFPF